MQCAGKMNTFTHPRENVLPVPPTAPHQGAHLVCVLVMPGLVESMNLMSHCRVWVSATDSASDSDSHSGKCQAPLAMCFLALIYTSWLSRLIHIIIIIILYIAPTLACNIVKFI